MPLGVLPRRLHPANTRAILCMTKCLFASWRARRRDEALTHAPR